VNRVAAVATRAALYAFTAFAWPIVWFVDLVTGTKPRATFREARDWIKELKP
jgi:hypothetical protein